MMTTGAEDVLVDVARAATGLLAAPTPNQPLRDDAAAAALICRDALLRELRIVLREVLRVGPAAPDPDPSMPRGSASRALHLALADLPLSSAADMPLREALSRPGGPLLRHWQLLAVEAIALEARVVGLSQVPVTRAFLVVRDVAALLDVLLELDGQLGQLLPAGFGKQRHRLSEQRRHARARRATAAVLATRATASSERQPGHDWLPRPQGPGCGSVGPASRAPNSTDRYDRPLTRTAPTAG